MQFLLSYLPLLWCAQLSPSTIVVSRTAVIHRIAVGPQSHFAELSISVPYLQTEGKNKVILLNYKGAALMKKEIYKTFLECVSSSC